MGEQDASMKAGRPVHHFGPFVLDENEKQLWREGERIPVNPRYFDALALMVRNPDSLVTKERFFDEVWTGVTVGDEALTQCIKSLRQALGDRHRDPAYIVTVPKYGYRFIAPVETAGPLTARPAPSPAATAPGMTTPISLALAGTLGGAAAGMIGGLVYGLGAVGSGGSAISVLFVLTALTMIVGLLGAAGVSFGMAAASLALKRQWMFSIAGAAAGGLLVGALFNMVGADSLYLLFGRAPDHFTGGMEGAALGAALAAGARLGGGLAAPGWRPALTAALLGAAAGVLISLAGGKLMGGSLSALAASFDQSRLELDAIGRLSGENRFGPIAQAIAAGAEGFLFAFFVVAAMLVRRRMRPA